MTTSPPKPGRHILLRTVFALAMVFALVRVCAVSSASSIIVITATVADAQGRTTDAQTTLTVMDLPEKITLDVAKSLEDGTVVQVKDLIASSSSADLEGLFYAQTSERSGGIGVLWDGSVNRGDTVSVVGSLLTVHGERLLQAQVVNNSAVSP